MVIYLYFHNGNGKSTTLFHKNECTNEEIYITGLKEGHYLKSDIPYFYIASNGHVSITSQMKSFGYFDPNNNLLKMINLEFITECPIIKKPIIEKGTENQFSYFSFWLWPAMALLILSAFLITKRRKIHVKNRIHR